MKKQTYVWILFNNCPSDFGGPSISAVYSNIETARKVKKELKDKWPYEYQYLIIQRRKVED